MEMQGLYTCEVSNGLAFPRECMHVVDLFWWRTADNEIEIDMERSGVEGIDPGQLHDEMMHTAEARLLKHLAREEAIEHVRTSQSYRD